MTRGLANVQRTRRRGGERCCAEGWRCDAGLCERCAVNAGDRGGFIGGRYRRGESLVKAWLTMALSFSPFLASLGAADLISERIPFRRPHLRPPPGLRV
jgi:hypothetical protein